MKRRIALTAVLASVTLATAACGGGGEETATAEDTAASDSMTSEGTESEGMDDMESGEMDPAANLVGPGCADYASQVPDGAGSVEGMAQDPVAVAASNNPLLTTLVSAVSGELNPEVDLVDTLNSDEFTVFAPVDDAFAQIDAATIETLKTDADLLSTILTYHVVPGQLSPDEVVGEQTTVQGGTVEVAGSGDELTVNDANVICGGVMTQNATVYLIDSVLMPSM
ncbi:MAG: fasciclin domain-containing protein [Actinomycetes bacterium]